ncbi:MAG: hypothetical protein UY92_C0001G0067 [Candidatus Magasanikbacteria bacterium GW2011_GWA2_56_11]|uniref:Uncharacterized protein n=1 Tax=Candidatus Magasanikbacteria bacterium GW2011_GWA2_56_11 TaxID=1619044 RepID=A0A0G1YHZ5_9BACT|nr:MAG: hypothetical protein UY92_C0001G0067 [Candidatus Magasanikbacteria bacterium GW2011_GWA2_56_11]
MPSAPSKKFDLLASVPAVFIISILSFFVRIVNFGFIYLFMTGIVDIAVRFLHLKLSLKFARHKSVLDSRSRGWFLIGQMSLITASLFMVDGDIDNGEYTFLGLISDPDPIYQNISLAAVAVLILADIKLALILRRKLNKTAPPAAPIGQKVDL